MVSKGDGPLLLHFTVLLNGVVDLFREPLHDGQVQEGGEVC